MSFAPDLFDGPVAVMLAKAQESIPGPNDRHSFEPKWDGFRAVVQTDLDGRIAIWSRNRTNLSRAFPDLVEAARNQMPRGLVLDGEAVVWVDGRLSFDHLQHRMMSSAAAADRLARAHPASYVAFDILAVDGQDVRELPWHDRRMLLAELAQNFEPPLQISPVTQDRAVAAEWFTTLGELGVEGLIVKDITSKYRPGERGWTKVKHREVVDGVVGAIIGPVTRPEAIVLGRYTADGMLVIVGRSTPLGPKQAKDLASALTPVPAAEHPWPNEISGGHFGGAKVAITHVQPVVVVEVTADSALQAGRHRHALRYVRRRPDLGPDDVEPAG